MIEVIRTEEKDREAWNEFLRSHDVTHHAYAWEWRSIFSKVFGHQALYLHVEQSEAEVQSSQRKIVGILPLFFIKSMLFGRALISVPYLNAGGIIAESEEVARLLLEAVQELGRELQVDYTELRQQDASAFYPTELPVRTHKVSMRLALKPNAEDLFQSFPPKLRSQVRRPTKSGMYSEIAPVDHLDDRALDSFFQVFSEHMRDLGTPVYPRRLFWETKRAFGSRCQVINVWHENQPVAAGITIGQGTTTEIPWASSLRKYQKSAPNMLLYWQAIKAACNDGYAFFDFGRSSPDSGTYKFKQQWGAEPRILHWYYTDCKAELPDVNPNSPKYRFVVNCWKRLPLAFTNRIGPWLTRSIP